ncbi:MAG: transposase [Magnetococcales bacterium]|nr:transposase [Magnetococcales bacterium]
MLGYHRRAFDCPRSAAVDRGPLQFFIGEEALSAWSQPAPTGRRGKPFVYSESLILSSLVLKNHYRLPYRMTAALFGDVLETLQVPVPPPDHSTLYYRNSRITAEWLLPDPEGSCSVVVEADGIHALALDSQPSALVEFHTVQFQVDAESKAMVLEYRLRLALVVQELFALKQNTTAAQARLDLVNNTFSHRDD